MSFGLSRTWALFALAAILFRALIPAGFMAEANANTGTIEIVVCTAHAGSDPSLVSIPIDVASESERDRGEGDLGAGNCPFALASVTTLPEADSLLSSPAIHAFERSIERGGLRISLAAFAPSAPPTGPPFLI